MEEKKASEGQTISKSRDVFANVDKWSSLWFYPIYNKVEIKEESQEVAQSEEDEDHDQGCELLLKWVALSLFDFCLYASLQDEGYIGDKHDNENN